MPRILQRDFRQEWEQTPYPFSDSASLVGTNGSEIPQGLFSDAVLHILGYGPRYYLSQVLVDFQTITLTIGAGNNPTVATGSFAANDPPDSIALQDLRNRPAGLLISTPDRLRVFQSWSIGSHAFTLPSTEFCAACCYPIPEYGVNSLVLGDGSLIVGEAWLAGGEGVVLDVEELPDPQDPLQTVQAIRVHVVGDPLFRRRLCEDVFRTPRLLQSITFKQGCKTIKCLPDSRGHVVMASLGQDTPETALRIYATTEGLYIGVAGETVGG